MTGPSDALQPLIPAAQVFTQQLVQVGDFIAQQGTQVSFVATVFSSQLRSRQVSTIR
ncbi:DUF3053 family protein [Shigella flexneri]